MNVDDLIRAQTSDVTQLGNITYERAQSQKRVDDLGRDAALLNARIEQREAMIQALRSVAVSAPAGPQQVDTTPAVPMNGGE